MAEREILTAVEKDGEVLVLLDGRKLRVDAKNLSKSVNWLPMQELEISEESNDPLYNLTVLNLERNEEVLAMWL
jgi:hypothetical protein